MTKTILTRILHIVALVAVSLIGLAPGIALTEWSSSWPMIGANIRSGYWAAAVDCGSRFSGFPFVYTREWNLTPGSFVPTCVPETDWTMFVVNSVIWALFTFGIFWAVLELSGAAFRRSFPPEEPRLSADETQSDTRK